MQKIFVTVIGGIAQAADASVPAGYEVEIVDFDTIDEIGVFPSAEARSFYLASGLYDDRVGRQRNLKLTRREPPGKH